MSGKKNAESSSANSDAAANSSHSPVLVLVGTQDDGLSTATSQQQRQAEAICFASLEKNNEASLATAQHLKYIRAGLFNLPSSYCGLDASRPWLSYWMLHAMSIMGDEITPEIASSAISFLKKCQDPEGGFCGGPGQLPHLAPTYAGLNTVLIVGTPEAYSVINRVSMYNFLLRMKCEDGAFMMHEGGEKDIRGTYTALAVAAVLGMLDEALAANAADYIARCQTFEGGFAGEPGGEAHGGYSFCAVAAVAILNELGNPRYNWQALHRWLVGRQMSGEGGFQGRTNKLVDGCYSFWQGSAFPLISKSIFERSPLAAAAASGKCGFGVRATSTPQPALPMEVDCDWKALSRYVLSCCQEPGGGLRDKPSKRRDYYHTCYVSIALQTLTITKAVLRDLFSDINIVGSV